ncbi:hypothetical protein JOD31_000098 [Methylopila capsulata]|uniref:Glyoxalase-like domain-containing protein n=1 Tax=Methylopila capsulata TaxID=61654 RepID=A0A9W6IU72_9HYPH|nr:VOC family protein [Methylopila capsulata]MBM7849886.1 hypothetical protein [Methylopila capsulata]GLK55176.1 hypothetical protein GCM10008170_11950 [Methylopila capsulata]
MPRGLDHLIHLVGDLDAAGEAWSALGFQVGAENRHPFGTKNRIVQLPGVFVELLAIADPALISEHGPRFFSFAAFQRDRLARAGEGASGLVLESADAKADAATYAAKGIGDFAPFFFERRGVRADGSPVEVAFELAFASDPAAPDVSFFACEQKRPENFWNPAAQAHPNGASAVAGVVLTAENPSDHHVFLRAFTGIDAFRATSSGLTFVTPRGEIDVLTGEAYRRRTGLSVEVGPELRLSALRIKVPAGAERVVPPERLFGLTLVLED